MIFSRRVAALALFAVAGCTVYGPTFDRPIAMPRARLHPRRVIVGDLYYQDPVRPYLRSTAEQRLSVVPSPVIDLAPLLAKQLNALGRPSVARPGQRAELLDDGDLLVRGYVLMRHRSHVEYWFLATLMSGFLYGTLIPFLSPAIERCQLRFHLDLVPRDGAMLRQRGTLAPYFAHYFVFTVFGNRCHGRNLDEPIAAELARAISEIVLPPE